MKGKGISEGLAIGRAWIIKSGPPDFSKWVQGSVESELTLFKETRSRLADRLSGQGAEARQKGNGTRAEILEAHVMMLTDPELDAGVSAALSGGQSLPAATAAVMNGFADLMAAMDDPYLQQRSQDYRDLGGQLLRALSGESDAGPDAGTDWIAVAEDFLPSDIGLAERGAVNGFLCQGGAETTHFSILARIAGLPTVIRAEGVLSGIAHGELLIVDGTTGEVQINPDPSALAEAQQRQAAGRIGILPGGGVTADNAERILRETGVRELHLSARKRVVLGPAEDDACYEADAGTVRTLREILDR